MWVVHGLVFACFFAAVVVGEWKKPGDSLTNAAALLTFTLVIFSYFTYAVNFWRRSINQ